MRKIVFEPAKRTLDKTVAAYAHGRGAGRAKRPEGLPALLPRGERRRRLVFFVFAEPDEFLDYL